MNQQLDLFRQQGRNTATGGSRPGFRWFVVGLLISSMLFPACGKEKSHEPLYYEVLTLEGTPYERGFQHGQALAVNPGDDQRRIARAGQRPARS